MHLYWLLPLLPRQTAWSPQIPICLAHMLGSRCPPTQHIGHDTRVNGAAATTTTTTTLRTTHKVRTTATPTYGTSASWYRPKHHLGVCVLPMLVVPRIHTELARRAFSVAAPRAPSTWNSLPAEIRLCENILTFIRHLKAHLLKLT